MFTKQPSQLLLLSRIPTSPKVAYPKSFISSTHTAIGFSYYPLQMRPIGCARVGVSINDWRRIVFCPSTMQLPVVSLMLTACGHMTATNI